MSVSQVNLKRTSSKATTSGRTAERIYQVIVTDPTTDDSEDARTASDGTTTIPGRGDAWPGQTALVCIDVTADQDDDSGLSWTVTARYSTVVSGGQAPTETEDPLTEVPIISIENDSTTEPADFEILPGSTPGGPINEIGSPILNTIGQPFDPPIFEEAPYIVFRIERNVEASNATIIEQYINTINSDEITLKGKTIAPGKAVMLEYTSVPEYRNGVQFDRETMRVAVREDGWNHNRLNTGFIVRNSSTNILMVKKDESLYPYNAMVPIDIDGYEIDTSTASDEDFVYLSFNTKRWLPFQELGQPFAL